MMSDVTEKTLDQKFDEQGHQTTIELTDQELERVDGAQAIAAQNLATSFFPFFSVALNQAAIAF